MKYLLILFISINVFALDLTYDTDHSTDTTVSEGSTHSKDKSIENSKKTERSRTKTHDKSVAKSKRVDYDGKIHAIAYLAALEKAGVKPFSQCRLITKPHNVQNFGLSCRTEYGVSGNLCQFLDNSAKSYAYISSVVDQNSEEQIKGYANCGLLYGGIIAQYLKTGKLSVAITDKKILNQLRSMNEEIENAQCNLAGSTTHIMCDSVTLDISNVLKMSANNYEVFGGNEYFGYKLNLSKDKSIKSSIAIAYVRSKARNDSNKMSKGIKYDQNNNYKLSRKAAANLSVGKFVSE